MKSFLLYISLILAIVGAYHALLVPHGENDYPEDDISSTDTATALAQLARKIKVNELAKTANTESISEVVSKNTTLQSDINSLVSRINSVETFVNGFSPTVSTDTSNTTTSLPSTVTSVLDDRISSIESEIDDLDTADREWKRKIALLEFQLPVQKLEISGMVTRTDAMLSTIDDLASTVNNVSILADTYEARATDLISTISNDANLLSDSLTERFASLSTNLGNSFSELSTNLGNSFSELSTQLVTSSGAVADSFLIRDEYIQARKEMRVDTGVRLFGADSNNVTACFASNGNETKERCALRQASGGNTSLSSPGWCYVDARGGNHIRCRDLTTTIIGNLVVNNVDVLAKLTELETRLADVEGNFLDTRKSHTLRSHNANQYLASSGNVDVGISSTHARWDIRNR